MEVNNRDYHYLVEFCNEFEKMIEELNTGTLRSYTILQEFFANESGKIAKNLRNFDMLFKELKMELGSERLVSANSAIEKAKDLEAKTKQKLNMSLEIKDTEASLQVVEREKNSILKEIGDFSKSQEHENFLKLTEERKSKTSSFFNDEDQLTQYFSVIERPLRKYSHTAFEHEELVLGYLKDPVGALSNDKDLKIADALASLKSMISEGKLQFDERKKEKAVEAIEKMDKIFLKNFAEKCYSFKSEMKDIDNKIIASGVAEKFRSLNKQLENANLRMESISAELGRAKIDHEKASAAVDLMKKEIESSVNSMFKLEISIEL
jgi:hypothetical protein